MRIDGITSCVGKEYAERLARSLPVWVDTLDSLTIVTNRGDQCVTELVGSVKPPKHQINLIYTDVFTRHGASFNKGAALNVAYAHANPQEWVLHFDADIIPSMIWRKLTERRLVTGCLHGVQRLGESIGGQPCRLLDETPIYPYGYFHLWHSSDPVTWRWPMFDPWHPHAGNYDADFADLWPRRKRVDLCFTVLHQGEPRLSWFGPDTPRDIHGMQHPMRDIHQRGLRETRLQAHTGKGRLAIPDPLVKVVIQPGQDAQWTRDVLQMCRSLYPNDPFAITARVHSQPPPTARTLFIEYPAPSTAITDALRGLIPPPPAPSPSIFPPEEGER